MLIIHSICYITLHVCYIILVCRRQNIDYLYATEYRGTTLDTTNAKLDQKAGSDTSKIS